MQGGIFVEGEVKMIEVRKPSADEAAAMKKLPTWSCPPSEFDWQYSDKETCLLLEGDVTVTYDGGEVSFGSGDLVVFPEGLSCVWKVRKAVRKHYKFGN